LINTANESFPLPHSVQLESSSACQLKCPSCPTAAGHTKKVLGAGFLKIENFKEFIDKNTFITNIELSNYGEAFLNPDILEIFKYAFEKKVKISLANGVNLNNVREDVLEGLVKYQVQKITCSIDGITQETYSLYRVKGNLQMVFENIEKINYARKMLMGKAENREDIPCTTCNLYITMKKDNTWFR
jgi:MoaA/NifB/PqqE/SkfB family radical SAM enzyme